MNFKQRLSRYLVGIFIGVLLSFVLFGQRNCKGWMPENRVKQQILEKPVRYTSYAECMKACAGISDSLVIDGLKYGAVDFSESDTRANPRRYTVDLGDMDVQSIVEMRDTASVVIELSGDAFSACDCAGLK